MKKSNTAEKHEERLPKSLPFSMSVERAALKAAVNAASQVVQRRRTTPILSYIALEAINSDSLRVRATDLDCEVVVTVPARNASGATALPGYALRGLLSALHAPDLDFGTASDGRISIVAGKIRALMRPLRAVDLPILSEAKTAHSFGLPTGIFDWLLGTRAVVCTEETRYYLCGACLDFRDGTLTAVCTDGHRLIERKTTAPAGAPETGQYIVPRASFGPLLTAARDHEPAVELLGDTVLRLTAGGVVLTSKLIDGIFPDWRKVIPQGVQSRVITVRSADLAAAIAEISALGDNDIARAIKIVAERKRLTLSLSNRAEGTEAEAPVDATLIGDPLTIGFNHVHLSGLLKTIAPGRDGFVTLATNGADAPCVIRAKDPVAEELAVLMPMRI